MSIKANDNYLKQELYSLIREDSRIFDFIQSGSLDGVWYWDLENPSEEWMSERFWTTLGYDPAQMPHSADAWQDIIDSTDLEVALKNFKAHCEDPEHPYDQVVRYRHRDGSTVWIRCRGLAIRNDQGHPIRMLGAHTDITQLKKSEKSLEQKNEALKSVNDELTSFAYAASHDMQAPVRNLHGLLEILREDAADQLSEENKALLDLTSNAAQRLQELMHGILEYAELGSTDNEMKNLDCQAMLVNIKLDLNTDLARQNADLVIGNLPTIYALPTPTRQLFQNLVSNAIKFQPDTEEHKPTCSVSSERYSAGWKFTVKDNGIGIKSAHLQKVFTAFDRLNLPGTFEGSGLGLALCQRAVQLHGGKIWVESEPGKGSSFHFTYPDIVSA